MNPKISTKDLELFMRFQKKPSVFIEHMWGLIPQPIKVEHQKEVKSLIDQRRFKEIKPHHFDTFIRGKHITWQQWLIVLAVERGIEGTDKKRISVVSGHGIGKSSIFAMLILWFLFCYKDAQIPCTAPTSSQMHDILWKEISVWLKRMPEWAQEKYDWTSEYVRVVESPETWFARARTGKKENPEALAGMHGDHLMFMIDEASGVPDEVYLTAQGSLTNQNAIVLMISNPTRLMGYFFESHHDSSKNWQTLQFDGEESPIVDTAFVVEMEEAHDRDSDEFRIRVKGQFPGAESMDDSGYVSLFSENDIRMCEPMDFVGTPRLGIDPSGEGDDESSFVGRDRFRARVLAREATSNPKTVTATAIEVMGEHNISPKGVMVDNFGVGADVGKEMALAPEKYDVGTINVGDAPKDPIYLNIRAEAFFRILKWFREGGSLVNDTLGQKLRKELLSIKYKRNLKGLIQIMPKHVMKKLKIKSPNHADALMLTFVRDEEWMEGKSKTYVPRGLDRNPRRRA